MSGFVPFTILVASFLTKNAYWKLERFDYLCGIFSVLALILWGITKEPSIAIVFAILSDALAAIPTITKSWSHPESEHSSPFLSGGISAATSFFAIQIWNFSSIAFPLYLVLINLGLTFAIERKRLYQ